MVYFVVHKTRRLQDNPRRQMMRRFDTASGVAAHMLGRRVSEYCIVKSDAQGDRVVPMLSADVFEIQQACEQA